MSTLIYNAVNFFCILILTQLVGDNMAYIVAVLPLSIGLVANGYVRGKLSK